MTSMLRETPDMTTTVRTSKSRRAPARHQQSTRPEDKPQFLVGKNSRGNWVVQDRDGLCGGLFIGQAAALKFALSENGNHPEAVRMVPGVLELSIAGWRAA
jgi:hypothetical protein